LIGLSLAKHILNSLHFESTLAIVSTPQALENPIDCNIQSKLLSTHENAELVEIPNNKPRYDCEKIAFQFAAGKIIMD
jgi:hypothetical protein